MKKKKILVTGLVSRSGLDELVKKFEVNYSEVPRSRESIIKMLPAYDGLILMGMKADRELIDAGENLQVISINGVGFDHVDVDYAKSKGITVSNAPQSVRVATAEMTFTLLLAATKRLFFYDQVVRNGQWIDVSEVKYQGLALEGSILGIYGMGRIGSTVAKYAQCFGMQVVYNDPNPLAKEMEKELNVSYCSFDQLLEKSDVISIHAPYLKSTKGIFNKDTFKKMKSNAYLINAARGPIVCEADLVEALQNEEIAGAGLDVFEYEPKVSEALRKLNNVIMAPHAGTGTVKGRHLIAQEAAGNLLQYFSGNPINVVNP